MTNILYQAELGVWILAYRAICSVELSFLLQNTFEKLSENLETNGNDEDANAVHNLISCCKLVTHNGSSLYSAPELMKESLIAVFLTRCLQARGYFRRYIKHINEKNVSNENVEFTDNQMKVAIWIHHLMRVAKFNSHEVTEYTVVNEKTEDGMKETSK